MRHVGFFLPAVVTVMAVGLLAGTSRAGIRFSRHDFSTYNWSQKQVCLPCHTPHNAAVQDTQGNLLGGPLWNHQLSGATYTLYVDSTTLQKVTGNVDQNSKLCLSCHDGTVALDSFGGGAGSAGTLQGPDNWGTDLSNEHPIGDQAIWPTGATYMVDPALRDAQGIMPLRPMADGRLAVGCSSCHEPHNKTTAEHMLWVTNNHPLTTVAGQAVGGSGLCLNCHKK